MPRLGEYLPDVTEGITRVEDFPKTTPIIRSRNYRERKRPRCGTQVSRLRCVQSLLHDLGDLVSEHPHEIHLIYSQHHCARCNKWSAG